MFIAEKSTDIFFSIPKSKSKIEKTSYIRLKIDKAPEEISSYDINLIIIELADKNEVAPKAIKWISRARYVAEKERGLDEEEYQRRISWLSEEGNKRYTDEPELFYTYGSGREEKEGE